MANPGSPPRTAHSMPIVQLIKNPAPVDQPIEQPVEIKDGELEDEVEYEAEKFERERKDFLRRIEELVYENAALKKQRDELMQSHIEKNKWFIPLLKGFKKFKKVVAVAAVAADEDEEDEEEKNKWFFPLLKGYDEEDEEDEEESRFKKRERNE